MILQEILINALFAYKLAIRSSGRSSPWAMLLTDWACRHKPKGSACKPSRKHVPWGCPPLVWSKERCPRAL